tara:strand:+ start:450 stop:1025 length:576 start_codon:yes stop_codon:yes gene_type:complete
MGIFSAIAQGLRNVVALGRAVGGLVGRVGQKVAQGITFVGKKLGQGVAYVGKKVFGIGAEVKPSGVIRETIQEAGTGTRNTGRGIIRDTATMNAPKTTISKPVGKQLTPPPLPERPLANPATNIRNVIEDRGFYYGSPQPERLFKGQLLPSDIPAGAKSLPLGKITQRGLGGLTKQQRISGEIGRLGDLII